MPIRVPPPEIPVISWLSPNKIDQGLLEFWNTELASYTPLDIGAPHPNQRQYPNFRLGRQAPVQGDEKWVLRTWVTDETNPDWFNWANKFAGEDAEFPTFIRTYREPRDTYTPRVKGTPLGTLYKTIITNPGSGYANGAYPSITFADPTIEPTSVAVAHAVVAADGTIAEAVLDFGGEGYSADLEFSVVSPINGTPAIGIAYVQPQIAILTREEASQFPPESEFYAGYLQVTRVYETIPGPTFYETSLDVDGAILTTGTTRKFCADITTGETIDTGVWCKTTSKPTDIDVICEESVVCREIPGNPMESTKKNEDGTFTTRTQTYIDTTTQVSGETIPGGTPWTWQYIEDVDGTNLVSWQWVEERDIPGQEIDAITYPYGPNGRRVTATQLVERSTYTRTPNGTANANFANALLVDEKLEGFTTSELVASKIGIYDEIPVAANQQGLGYFVEYPYDGDPNFPRLTWRFQILRLSATTAADLSACPISGFTSLQLVDQKTEEADELIEVKVVRTYEVLPGKPIPAEKPDKDGKIIETVKTKKDESTITAIEVITAGVWINTSKEPIGGGVAWEVVEARDVPGNPLVTTKPDKDGKPLGEVRTLKDTTTITVQEVIDAGFWIKTSKEAVSDLVAYEVVTVRPVEGNDIPSAKVDAKHEVSTIATRLEDASTITPSVSESGGFITTVEQNDVSDLVSEKVTTVTKWLDEASYAISIINLIPREFMAFIPTFTESHILVGTASMQTLGLGEFEHSQRQLTELLYEDRIVSLGAITLPITHINQETTEEYGGGVLNITYTLEDQGSGTIDEGLLVTESTLTDLGNGMEVKLTKILDDTAWPILASRLWDENYRVEYDETKQVVAAGTSEDPNPGGVFAWVSEVKGIDKWRSIIINTSKPTPDYVDSGSALITYEFKPFKFPGLLTLAIAGYYVRSAYAELIQHTLRTWWETSATTPVITVENIIPDNVIISTLNDVTVLAYSGMVLHDDLTTFGVLFWPATDPSYTDYIASWQGFEHVIAATVKPEKEKDVWRITTESVTMR